MLRIGLIAFRIVWPFWAKSGKYYSEKREKFISYEKKGH